MSPYDLVIRNAKTYLTGGPIEALNIGIGETRILTLTTEPIRGKEEIDAQGRPVIPGVIDPHMHCWRGSEFETMGNASRAAVKGGITTLIDMPVDRPIPSTPKVLHEKIAEGEGESWVDFALYAGIGFEGLNDLPKLLAEPVVAVKLFMDTTPPVGKYPGLNTGEILDALLMTAKSNRVASVHCEDGFIIDRLVESLKAKGRKDPLSFAESRPPVSEYAAILKVLALVEHSACRTIIAHISIPEGVEAISRARAAGVPAYAETTPHYLLLTLDDLARDVRLKYKPPNRDKGRVDQLWDQLRKGLLQLIGSDHAPLPKNPRLNIWEINGGVGNMVELMLPLLATEALGRRRFTLEQLVRIMCENPARIFGIYPRKGCIQVGADADLVILHLEANKSVRPEDLSMVVPPYSPFEGWPLSVCPEAVIVGGRPVVREGRIVSDRPRGRFVPGGSS